jgi:hypothetical protein
MTIFMFCDLDNFRSVWHEWFLPTLKKLEHSDVVVCLFNLVLFNLLNGATGRR